jgi:hypothetical protein
MKVGLSAFGAQKEGKETKGKEGRGVLTVGFILARAISTAKTYCVSTEFLSSVYKSPAVAERVSEWCAMIAAPRDSGADIQC